MDFLPYIPPAYEGPASVFDASGLDALRRGLHAGQADSRAVMKVAQQFEALFVQQMLKQARQAGVMTALLDSPQVRMAQDLGNEQLARHLADPGLGLAQALLDQIRGGSPRRMRDAGEMQGERAAGMEGWARSAARLTRIPSGVGMLSAIDSAPRHVHDFVSAMGAAARAAARQAGLPAQLVLGQAALESGWGRREIRHEDGAPSHNLFGIKAGPGWHGPVVNVLTTEFVEGAPRKTVQPFRAYGSYEESFADYARLIAGNARYRAVSGAATAEQAAHFIQQAGYATDPSYARKLISIMGYFRR